MVGSAAEGGRQNGGYQRLRVCVPTGCPNVDVYIKFVDTDIRCSLGLVGWGATNSLCPAANHVTYNNGATQPTASDYGGEVQVGMTFRITDHDPSQEYTAADFPFSYAVSCTPTTADPTIGSNCNLDTTMNSVLPTSVTSEAGKRANIGLSQLLVHDGGPDGIVSTQDNSRFQEAGIFIP
jgi:hypothetical protein